MSPALTRCCPAIFISSSSLQQNNAFVQPKVGGQGVGRVSKGGGGQAETELTCLPTGQHECSQLNLTSYNEYPERLSVASRILKPRMCGLPQNKRNLTFIIRRLVAGLSLWKPGSNPRPVHVRSEMDKVTPGQIFFLEYFGSLLSVSSTNVPYTPIHLP